MKLPENVAYRDLTINGLTFEAPEPYTEGHPLTAAEASQLNQVLAENLRNNFATTVEKAKEEAAKANEIDVGEVTQDHLDLEALRAAFDKYVDEYEMGMRRGGGARLPADPIEREALELAKEKVRTAIKKQNIALNTVPAEKLRELAEKLLASDAGEAIRSVARERVEAARKVAAAEIDLSDL